MSEINWKNKYTALKAKYMTDIDAAFRLGYEQGQTEAQVDSVMQQQQQQADEMQQQGENGAQGGDQNGEGDSGEQVPGDEQAPAQSANPGGSELDQHISKLESMVAKGEISPADLMKSINDFRSLQKSMVEKIKFDQEMKKSYAAIPAIAKALHKPSFKISQQASHNLNDSAKKAVGMQQKIVSDIMKSWADEEQKASKGILGALSVEGLIKKD